MIIRIFLYSKSDVKYIFFPVMLWYICTDIKKNERNENTFLRKRVIGLSKFSDLKDNFIRHDILVLKGRKGTGKCTIATCLQRYYSRNACKIIRIRKQELSDNCPNPSLYIVDIDDSIGNYIESLWKMAKKTKLMILVEDFPSELSNLLQNKNYEIFDLDEENFYSAKDKENILKSQMKSHHILSEDEWLLCQTKHKFKNMYMKNSLASDLLKERTLRGFPWMCASLCSDQNHIDLGFRYFRQPPADFILSLDELKEKGEYDDCCAIQYCLLVSVLLINADELTVDNITQNSFKKTMLEIYPKKKKDFALQNVIAMLFQSRPVFFNIDSDSNIEFSHHSIYHAVLLSYGKTHTATVMDKCNVSDLIFYLRPYSYTPMHDEICLKANYSQKGFVERVIHSLMSDESSAKTIIDNLTIFTEWCEETDLLQLIIKEIKSNKSCTYQNRIRFFRHLDFFSHAFTDTFKTQFTAYCLAWDYVLSKLDENERKSNELKQMILKSDVIRDVLHTCIDQYDNTLLHYFVIWNGHVEKSILFELLSTNRKGLFDEQLIADMWIPKEVGNAANHTPLHFAAYFGCFDFFHYFKDIIKIKRNKEKLHEKIFDKIVTYIYQESTKLKELANLGRTNSGVKVRTVNKTFLLFEMKLVPFETDIKFGPQAEFDKIVEEINNERHGTNA